MSITNNPPFLNRWLSVNKVVPLTRVRTFITLPVFSIVNDLLGYSTIMGAFNFEAPNNFSLVGLSDVIPDDPNYTLCISYVNDDFSVVRYSLWRASGDLMYFTLPEYEGQLIKKNFRLEIWGLAELSVATTLEQLTAIVLNTSVLGDVDYRSGSDKSLVGDDGLCSGQQSVYTTPVFTSPFDGDSPPPTGLMLWFDNLHNITGIPSSLSSWVDRQAGYTITDGTPPAGETLFSNNVINMFATGALTSAVAYGGSATNIYLAVYLPAAGVPGIIFTTGAGLKLEYTATPALKLTTSAGNVTTAALEFDTWYIVSIRVGLGTINVYNINTLTLVLTASVGGGALPNSNLTIGGGGTFLLFDFLAYSTIPSAPEDFYIRAYIRSFYGQFSFPITWGTCAQPTTNN